MYDDTSRSNSYISICPRNRTSKKLQDFRDAIWLDTGKVGSDWGPPYFAFCIGQWSRRTGYEGERGIPSATMHNHEAEANSTSEGETTRQNTSNCAKEAGALPYRERSERYHRRTCPMRDIIETSSYSLGMLPIQLVRLVGRAISR